MLWKFANADQSIIVNLEEDSNTGSVWGSVKYGGLTYPVTGNWQASGSLPGRVSSVFEVFGRMEPSAAPTAPNYLAMSGLITGSAPNMTSMIVGLNVSSSYTGEVHSLQSTLTPIALDAPVPGKPAKKPGGAQPPVSSATWLMASTDGSVIMDMTVDGHGDIISGSLTVDGDEYGIGGNWAWREAHPNRNASNFGIIGSYKPNPAQDASNYLAAAGTMEGPWPSPWPLKVQISGNIAPIGSWHNAPFTETLIPMMRDNPQELGVAYDESYMVLTIDDNAQNIPECVAGWIGQTDGNGNVQPIMGTYKTTGVALTEAQRAPIVTQDPSQDHIYLINLPALKTANPGNRPVMVQFPGTLDHFGQPPLAEPHTQIAKQLYDSNAGTNTGALVLQFDNNSNTMRATQKIVFRHDARKKRHDGVIIQPSFF